MMTVLTEKVGRYSKIFALGCFSLLEKVLSVSQNHAQIWNLSLTFVLKIPSYLCILPFVVNTNRDGLRVLKICETYYGQRLPYAYHLILWLRWAYFAANCLDSDFKWIRNGQFTADASFFLVWLFFGSGACLIHYILLSHREDVVFLCNSAMNLNRTFAGKLGIPIAFRSQSQS